MTAVRAERLGKRFVSGLWRRRAQDALADLTFEIPLGGVFGLLGPNGAGKTTTLKILMNLLWPTSGTASVLGYPPGHLDARRRVGFLPEHPTFYDHLSAEELLGYFAGLFGANGAERRRRATAALDQVGLFEDRCRPIRQYSKGMVQRVGLAQALVNDPEVVILDEPMSGLDPLGRRDVRQLILGLRDAGRTVVFSSHVLSDAEALCSRIGILAKGRLVAAGPLSDLPVGRERGWEIVVTGLERTTADRISASGARVTTIGAGHYSIELPLTRRPEPLVAELAAAGAELVSALPLRTTLEDVFVEALGAQSVAGSGGPPPARGPS